ncbi:unnamed protein product, partial [Discosporangium mesarthrocarpum]
MPVYYDGMPGVPIPEELSRLRRNPSVLLDQLESSGYLVSERRSLDSALLTTVSQTLELGHGTKNAVGAAATVFETIGNAGGAPAGIKVILGVLTFASLREEARALASLFLADETGKIRLLCVPPPPSKWLGKVVAIVEWTLVCSENHPRTPFWSYLEVQKMLLTGEGGESRRISMEEAELGGGVRLAAFLRQPDLSQSQSSPFPSGSDPPPRQHKRARSIPRHKQQPPKGPVPLIGRVVAVSPAITLKDRGCQLFMVEVDDTAAPQCALDLRTPATGPGGFGSPGAVSVVDPEAIKAGLKRFYSPHLGPGGGVGRGGGGGEGEGRVEHDGGG